jgi:hypothetical protein
MKYIHMLNYFLTKPSAIFKFIIEGKNNNHNFSLSYRYVIYDILAKAMTNTFSWDVTPRNRERNTGVSPKHPQYPCFLAEICCYS